MFGQCPVYPTGFEFFKENCSEKGRIEIAEVTKKLMPYQNPSRYYYNLIINLKFQHKPKYRLSKILI
jgi:hypothetical protein